MAPLAAGLGDRLRRGHALALGYGLQGVAMLVTAVALALDAPFAHRRRPRRGPGAARHAEARRVVRVGGSDVMTRDEANAVAQAYLDADSGGGQSTVEP